MGQTAIDYTKEITTQTKQLSPMKRRELLDYAFFLKEREEWEATKEVLEDDELMAGLVKGLEAKRKGKVEPVEL